MPTYSSIPPFNATNWTASSGYPDPLPTLTSNTFTASYPAQAAAAGGFQRAVGSYAYDAPNVGDRVFIVVATWPSGTDKNELNLSVYFSDGKELKFTYDTTGATFIFYNGNYVTDRTIGGARPTMFRGTHTAGGLLIEAAVGGAWSTLHTWAGPPVGWTGMTLTILFKQTNTTTPCAAGTFTAQLAQDAPAITSVALSPANTSAVTGTTVLYTGTATLSDATTRPVTSSDGQFGASVGTFGGTFGVWTAPGSSTTGTITFVVPANANVGQSLVTATTPVTVVGARLARPAVGIAARTLVTLGRRDLRARFSDRPAVRSMLGPLNNATIPVPPTPPAGGRVLVRSVIDS